MALLLLPLSLIALVGTFTVQVSAFTTQLVSSVNDTRCQFASWPFPVNVLTTNSPPFMFVTRNQDGTTDYSGFSFDLLQTLAVNLNFCYTLQSLPDNSTIQDVIDEIKSEGTATNFGIAAITITGSRLKIIDFSLPMYDLALRILVNKLETSPVANRSIWQFLRPFSWSLWLLTAALCVIFGVTLYVIERRKNEFDFTYSNVPANVALSMFYMFALFLQVMYATPETWAGRMLYSSFLGFSFVMTASYTAQLASFLTYQGRKLYFRDTNQNTVIDYIDLRAQASQVCIRVGGAVEQYFRNFISTDYVGKASIAECVQAVRTGEVIGFAYDEPILTYIADQSAAEFDVIGEPFYKQNYGIAIQRGLANGTFQRAVSEELLILRESGVIDRLEQTWFPPVDAEAPNDTSQMHVNELLGLFIITAAILAVAWAMFLFKECRSGWPSFQADKLRRERVLTEERKREILNELKTEGNLPSRSISERLRLDAAMELANAADASNYDETVTDPSHVDMPSLRPYPDGGTSAVYPPIVDEGGTRPPELVPVRSSGGLRARFSTNLATVVDDKPSSV